jgi:hypothetical protein
MSFMLGVVASSSSQPGQTLHNTDCSSWGRRHALETFPRPAQNPCRTHRGFWRTGRRTGIALGTVVCHPSCPTADPPLPKPLLSGARPTVGLQRAIRFSVGTPLGAVPRFPKAKPAKEHLEMYAPAGVVSLYQLIKLPFFLK